MSYSDDLAISSCEAAYLEPDDYDDDPYDDDLNVIDYCYICDRPVFRDEEHYELGRTIYCVECVEKGLR